LHACAEACAAIPEHVIAQMARAKPQITWRWLPQIQCQEFHSASKIWMRAL
jgi:hypothetical protein